MDWGLFRPSRPTFVCLVLLSLSFLLMTFRLTRFVQSFRSFLFYWISPSYETVSSSLHAAGGAGMRLAGLVMADQENRVLKEKAKRFPLVEARLREAELENHRLKLLLDLKSSRPYHVVPALVSGRDAQNWAKAVWIDHGNTEDVSPDSPVMAVEGDPLRDAQVMGGIVGRILDCSLSSSKVLLISDPLSSVAVTVTRTGDQGLLQGHGSFLMTIEYLEQSADLHVGDEVVTNGLGGIFPAGLPVGRISRVLDASSGFRRVEVRPAVSLDRIREVLVLEPNKPKVP